LSYASAIQNDSHVVKIRAVLVPDEVSWMALAAVIVFDVVWLSLSHHFVLDLSSLFALLPSVVVLGLLAVSCRLHGGELPGKLHEPLMGTMFVIVAFNALRIFNHLTMSIPFPFVDDDLARLDGLLGLNWLAYTTWVSHYPWIVFAFQVAYQGLTLVTAVIFAMLFVVIGSERAREFCRLVFWTSLVTAIIGVAFPARAAMDRFASTSLRSVFGPDAGVYPIPYITAARGPGVAILDMRELPGLIAMPSFHTICGLLIVYSCRGHRLLFPLVALYCATMIASAPILGGHYFVDLIAGAVFTAIAIAIDFRVAGRGSMGNPVRL
jgi:hypothetical protein